MIYNLLLNKLKLILKMENENELKLNLTKTLSSIKSPNKNEDNKNNPNTKDNVQSDTSPNSNSESKNQHELNEAIPILIDKMNSHNKELNRKFYASQLFQIIDNRMNKDFNKYIEDSITRHKASKSGNTLDVVVSRTQRNLEPLNEKILNNKLYTSFNLALEKEKMKNKLNIQENKQIEKMIKDLKQKTVQLSDFEKEFRAYLEMIVEEKKKEEKERKDPSYFEKLERAKLLRKEPKKQIFYDVNKNISISKNYLNKYLNEDKEKVQKQFDTYNSALGEILQKVKMNKSPSSKSKVSKKNLSLVELKEFEEENKEISKLMDNVRKVGNFDSKGLKALNYVKPPTPPKDIIEPEKPENMPIDLKELMKALENKESKKVKNYKEKSRNKTKIPSWMTPKLEEEVIKNAKNFKDNKYMVLNETRNIRNLDIIAEKRYKKFNKLFTSCELPSIKEYPPIIDNKVKQAKMEEKIFTENNSTFYDSEESKRAKVKKHLKDFINKWNITSFTVNDVFK